MTKSIIITGVTSGIGLAIAEMAIRDGYHVFGLARTQSKLDELAISLGEHFTAISCDVRSEASVQAAFKTILSSGQTIFSLVNNAGLGIAKPVDELSSEEWTVQIDTNLTGAFLCTREVVPHMKQNQDGVIINIASIAGTIGNPQLGAYNASKFGLVGWSESIMKELRGDGIRVSAVCPGSVDTAFFDGFNYPVDLSKAMKPEDIARVTLFLINQPSHVLIDTVIMRPTGKKS